MERTRTSGIYVDAAGNRIVDKWFNRERIFARLGPVSQPTAESWLAKRIDELRQAKLFGKDPRRTFREAAVRHLAEERERLSEKFGLDDEGEPRAKAQKQLDDTAWHIRLVDPFIGDLQLEEVCNETLAPFVNQRKQDGVKPRTVAVTLQRVARILNKAAREWREKSTRRPWLRQMPPRLRLPKGLTRAPFPLSREEERRLFSRLSKHLAEMCLFKVNTGLREAEVCGLRWEWERKIDGAPSVFVLPPDSHKGGDYENYRLVVLNSVARAIVEARRGQHATHVFNSPRTKQPMTEINKNAFTKARKEAGLRQCRIHDLKHTFGARLKAAGVSHELRQVLLGHKNESVTTHYSRARIDELQDAVEKVLSVGESVSVIRVIGSAAIADGPAIFPRNDEAAEQVQRPKSLRELVGAK
jgi:integrase